MNDPSISPGVAKTDHHDPPKNQTQTETQQLAATPSNTSMSSDHGSSTVMIASMTSHDEPKTDTSDFGVESVDSTVTIALDSSSGGEGNASSHSVIIEGSMVETRGNHKDDAGSEASVEVVDDVEETTTSAAIYGGSNVDDERHDDDEEEEKPIQTMSSILATQPDASAVPEIQTFNYQVPFPTSYERGPHNETHPPLGTSPDFSRVDMRPYPPVPPGGFAMHSPMAQHVMDVPRVTMLLPEEDSSEDVETISRADFQEVDRRQETMARDLMREIEAAQPPVTGTYVHTQNTMGLQVSFLGDRDQAGGIPADFMQRFTQGQGMLQAQQSEAERKVALEARHKARVASDLVEAQGRNSDFREKLKKVREGSVPSPEGTDAAPSAGAKGPVKQPPKPKSKGARIMALRAAKSATSKLSRPEVQAPVRKRSADVGRVPSANPASVENIESTSVKTLVPSADDATAGPTLFNPPTRTTASDRPVKTYRRIDPRALPGLQPAIANYSQNLPGQDHQGDEQDDFTGSETAADDEDADSGDSQAFGSPSVRLEHANRELVEQTHQLILQALCSAMATLLPFYRQTIVQALDGSGTPTSETSDNEEVRLESMRTNIELSHAVNAAEQLYDAPNTMLRLLTGLLERPEVIVFLTAVTGSEMAGHRYIQLFLDDLWKFLADDLEDDFDDSDGQYDHQETDRGSSNDQPLEVEVANKEKGGASIPSPSGLAEPFRVHGQGKMSLNAILCDRPGEQSGATTSAQIEPTEAAQETKDSKVTLEPWMIEATPTTVKAKAKKNKRKKKAITRSNDVEASGPVSEKGKNLPRSLNSGLKASNSVASVLTSDESAPEPLVKSPFATKNIFEQLKHHEDSKPANQPPGLSAHADEAKVAVGFEQAAIQKQLHGHNVALSQDAGSKPDSQAPLGPEASGLQTDVIKSWADCEVDPPNATSTGANLSPDDIPANDKTSTGAHSRKVDASFKTANASKMLPLPRPVGLGNSDRQSSSSQRLPSLPRGSSNRIVVDGAGTSAVSQTNERPLPSGRLPFPPGLGFRNQSPKPSSMYNQGLSLKDISEGATIELHPTKGTECIILREPRERPDYSCTLFAAGVPYYNESVVTWQQLRAFITDHFRQFGPVDKVRAIRDANSGHVNAFVAFQNRNTVDQIFSDPDACIISVPGIPNSYDRSRFSSAVLRRHEVDGVPWMDVKVRLERAQGARRVYIHLDGSLSEPVTGSGRRERNARSHLPLPSTVKFESYLDAFGQDRNGREKYRLRKRLHAPVNPHDFEVNRRRDQTPYPREESVEVHLDASREQESIRRLCEVFGDLEDLRPWTETDDKGFEAVFYDRDCALRALYQIRLIPGASAFWSHDKRGLKPAATTSSLPSTLPVTGATDSSRNTLFAERPSADTQADPEIAVPKPLTEEWPSLSMLNIPRKKCVELPAEDSKVASLSHPQELPSKSQPVSPAPASRVGVKTGVESEEQVLPSTPKAVEASMEPENIKVMTLGKGSQQVDPMGSKERETHSDDFAALPQVKADSPSAITALLQDASPPKVSATAAALPLTPSVRMSPAPSGDPKMTIVVEGLSKKEPEEEVDSTYTLYTKRATIRLSYNSVHSARQAVEAENGREVWGRKQSVKFIHIPKPYRQLKSKRLKRPAAIHTSDVITNQDLDVSKSSERVIEKQNFDESPISGQPDGTVRTHAVKTAVRTDKEDSQGQGSPSRSINTPSTIPMSGRKRAFSDPGDVKRPSTAGTDRRLETLAPQAPQDPYSSTATAPVSEESVNQHLPSVINPPFMSTQAQSRAGYTVPVYMPLGQPMPYEGFGHAAPISTEPLQYYPYPNANQLPPFPLVGQIPNAFPSEQVQESRTSQYGGNEETAMPGGPNALNLAQDRLVESQHPRVVADGLKPYTFSHSQFGLTAVYDPQELSKYRRDHGLHVDTRAPPARPSNEPPLTLLPISSGGHSPTKSTNSPLDQSDEPVAYGRISTQPERQDDHKSNLAQAYEGPNQHLYPLYLQDANGQYYGYGMNAYQMESGPEGYQRSHTEIQPSHALAYSAMPYASHDHITPSGNSAYRAPMQIEPAMAANPEQRVAGAMHGLPAGTYAADLGQTTMISQLAGYGHAGAPMEDQFVSVPSAPDQQEARYYNPAPFGIQYSGTAQYPGHFGQSAVYTPVSAVPAMYPSSPPFVSPPAMATPGMPSSGNDLVRTAQQQRSMGMSQDRQAPRPGEALHFRSVPRTVSGGRQQSLPMQAAAFRASEAGADYLASEAERSARSRQIQRKPRGMTRGVSKPPRGGFRQ